MDHKIQEKLRLLRLKYAEQLPHKIAETTEFWSKVSFDGNSDEMKQFHRLVHTLHGSAGTFGFLAVSAIAQELETIVRTVPDVKSLTKKQKSTITRFIHQLKQIPLNKSLDGD